MNSKERMFAALDCEEPDVVPAAPHWWGVYKFESYCRDPRWAWHALDGQELAKIDANFYEHFKPDWFHLDGGVPRSGKNYRVEDKNGRLFLVEKRTGLEREILPDQSLSPSEDEKRKRLPVETRDDVDRLMEQNQAKYENLIQDGYTDHVQRIAKKYGDAVLIAVNVGGPTGQIYAEGFAQGLVGLFRKPAVMKYWIMRAHETHLEMAQAYASAGCHAFIASEDRVGADIIPPKMFEAFFLESQKKYYHEIQKMGMKAISYYCGNVMPILGYLKQLDIDGLLVEESRKNFDINILKIKETLEGKACIFGNLDTVNVLWRGSLNDISRAVRDQIRAASGGGFVAANGSPIAPGTPHKNIDFFIKSVRENGRYTRPVEVHL
nr:uroporphyrinogen decarboxylase family protein [Candidatus Njordarchaeum guaymaensis]